MGLQSGLLQGGMFWALCAALLFVLVVAAAVVAGLSEPSYKAQPIMTPNEQEFFGRLVRALPDSFVFPQVAMSALISPKAKGRKAHLSAFRRISQKRVDYAVFTRALELVCVVELDDRTHDSRKDAERDRMLKSAGISTVRWHSKRKPLEADIRAEFQRLLQERAAARQAAGGRQGPGRGES